MIRGLLSGLGAVAVAVGVSVAAMGQSTEAECYRAVRAIVDGQAPDTRPEECSPLDASTVQSIKLRAFEDATDEWLSR